MKEEMSVTSAVRKVAELAWLEWSDVLPYFRALQDPPPGEDDPWMPKSVGRLIWPAHPNFIVPLLIALAAAKEPKRSNEAVAWVYSTKMVGSDRPVDEIPFRQEMARFLADEGAAASLDHVEFQPDLLRVVFHLRNGEPRIFSIPVSLDKNAPARSRPSVGRFPMRTIIPGVFFREMAEAIAWREPSAPPYRMRSATEQADEA